VIGVTVTINDVARVAGVSKSTVSRVLNKSGGVSPETERKVLKAMAALNYRPSFLARGLATQKSYSIAIVVPDIRNPFFAHVCWKAEQIMRDYGYSAIICNTGNQISEEEVYLRRMKDRSVDGIFIASAIGDATNIINFRAQEKIPVLLFDVAVVGYGIPSVSVDDFYGGRRMTEYLIGLGHRRIAFATSDVTYAERQRLSGYKAALWEAGIPVDEQLIIMNDEAEWSRGECQQLVELMTSQTRPTAIFCSNDLKAIRTYGILQRCGLRIPYDVSVVGYDNLDVVEMMSPPLTTMSQPVDEMVEVGVSMLIAELQGQERQEWQREFKPTLVERESCRPLS
jgi:DNA-binding LacI/PurR family transcriptional regulator